MNLTKVIPEMRKAIEEVGLGARTIPTPTGRYAVTVRKTGQVLCLAPNENVADALAMLIHNHSDEWNNLVDQKLKT